MKQSVSKIMLSVSLTLVAIALALLIIGVVIFVNADFIAHPFIVSPGNVVTLAGVPYSWCPKSSQATTSVIICDPGGLAFDARRGFLFVADSWGYGIRRVDAAGAISTFAGSDHVPANTYDACADVDGPRKIARLCEPTDVAYEESSDRLYFTDSNAVREVSADGNVSTIVASNPKQECNVRGTPYAPIAICDPRSLAIDPDDESVWITDGRAILRIDRKRRVTLVAGDCVAVDLYKQNDGIGRSACLAAPHGIRYDRYDHTMIFADGDLIRTINDAGRVSTLAGWRYPPSYDMSTDTAATACRYWDGPRLLAVFCGPNFPTADDQGNIYVTDSGNEAVRKIDRDGTVSTVAGHYYIFGTFGAPTCKGVDGSGFGAKFCSPSGMALNTRRNILYVSDSRARQIREVMLPPVN